MIPSRTLHQLVKKWARRNKHTTSTHHYCLYRSKTMNRMSAHKNAKFGRYCYVGADALTELWHWVQGPLRITNWLSTSLYLGKNGQVLL